MLLLVQGSRCLNQPVISFRFGFNLVDGVNNITEITIQRGWTALGGHVWQYCAAAVIVKETNHFEWANIIDKRFIFFFLWQ